MIVYSSNNEQEYKEYHLKDVLPFAFGPKDLGIVPEDHDSRSKKNGIRNGIHTHSVQVGDHNNDNTRVY